MRGEWRPAAVLVGCLWAVPLPAEEQPSAELLEFLGSFETAKGRWIDPTQLPVAPAPTAEAPDGAKEKRNERDEE